MARALNLPQAGGALVSEVVPDSPALRAGLQAGDVITSVGDTRVETPRDLARIIAERTPGEAVALTVQRDGGRETLRVTLAELSDGPARAPAARAERAAPDSGPLGLTLAPADNGAAVASVRPESAAATAGLRAGDVIVGVQNRSVATPAAAVEAIRAAGQANRGAVALRVLRDGRTSFIALPTDEPAQRG